MSFHAMLKEARREKGLTLRFVADRLGISPSTLLRYEDGQILRIPAETLYGLYSLYGLEPEKECRRSEAVFLYQRLSGYAESRQTIDADFLYKRYSLLDARGRSAVLSVLFYETGLRPVSALQ